MSTFRQLPLGSVRGDYRSSAAIRLTTHELTERCGMEWTEFDDNDGLGPALGAVGEASNGQHFGLQFHFGAPTSIGILVDTLYQSPGEAETLDAALGDLRLTTADLTWLRDDLRFTPHALIRQDDHGNQFCVGTYPCRADALAAEREFRKSFHKQEYWIVPAKP